MRECTVSVAARDGQTYRVAVKAESLFDAASQAAGQWARFWWYQGDEVVEVSDGARRWKVRLDRARRRREGR